MFQPDAFKFSIESQAFGVCERIGDKLKMPVKMKDYVKGKRIPVWDF